MLHERLGAAARSAVGDDYEIVLVNDGSRDGSWPIMQSMAGGDPHVVAVNLSRNHGHQLALTAGLDLCRGETILIIDADLQDPPELLPAMMATMDARARRRGLWRAPAAAPARPRSSAPPRTASTACCRARPRSTSRSTPAISG